MVFFGCCFLKVFCLFFGVFCWCFFKGCLCGMRPVWFFVCEFFWGVFAVYVFFHMLFVFFVFLTSFFDASAGGLGFGIRPDWFFVCFFCICESFCVFWCLVGLVSFFFGAWFRLMFVLFGFVFCLSFTLWCYFVLCFW